jgi:hypothetical protein
MDGVKRLTVDPLFLFRAITSAATQSLISRFLDSSRLLRVLMNSASSFVVFTLVHTVNILSRQQAELIVDPLLDSVSFSLKPALQDSQSTV